MYTFIPLLVLLICNSLILCTLHFRNHLRTTNERTRTSIDVKLTFLLVTVSVIFCVLTSPYWFAILYFWYQKDYGSEKCFDIRDNKYWNASFILTYSNHAVNFFLYAITGGKIRRELKSLFRFGRAERSNSHKQNRERKNVDPVERNNLTASTDDQPD